MGESQIMASFSLLYVQEAEQEWGVGFLQCLSKFFAWLNYKVWFKFCLWDLEGSASSKLKQKIWGRG